MTDTQHRPGSEVEPEEPFMSRWSRLKARSREQAAPEVAPVAAPVVAPVSAPVSAPDAEAGAAPPQAAEGTPQQAAQQPAAGQPPELPDIDSLGEDSDYSAFLAEGVDATLRRKALRKLFHSPKFNVLDGLDDYMGDYTQFEPLGSIVTADMRFQIERAARLAEQALAGEGDGPSPTGGPDTAPVVAEAAPGDDSSEPATEKHDEPDRTA